jgi:uncharacterized protein YggL (DUF469 family)
MSAPCPTLGFPVSLELVTSLDRDGTDRLDASWRSFIDARGLRCVGGRGRDGSALFVTSVGAQATEADRTAVKRWLSDRRDLSGWTVGDLEDRDER